jgi:glucosamine-6-phosphate deaminase
VEVIVTDDVAARAVAIIAACQPTVLALPTGETPKPLYRALAAIDLSNATTFNLDEYVGLPEDHPASFHRYMREHFKNRVKAMHLPDGNAADLAAECARYEAAIAAAGGIDLCVLGLGANGHIAFNEPGSPRESRTRVVTLVNRPAPRAITMGMATILEARRCLLIATGREKAAAVRALKDGDVPAAALREHPSATIVIDHAAAGQ